MQQFERQYLNLVKQVLNEGETVQGRNGTTKSIFGAVLDIDMSGGNEFPLLLSRRIYSKGILGEFAAFLRGPQSIEDFEKQGCNYWKDWGNTDGTINVDYGNAWLDFNGVNQLAALKEALKTNPNNRRMLISGWNPGNLSELNLPCCHLLYQWYVRDTEYLDMIWYQRSADTMIGIPSDIVLAAIFNILLANNVGLKPGRIKMVFGNTHIYEEHFASAQYQLDRSTHLSLQHYPQYYLAMEPEQRMEDFTAPLLSIENYEPMGPIKFELKA